MDESSLIVVKNCENNLNYTFKNKEYLLEALTHRTYANENSTNKMKYNQRLEFLGDSVLSLIINEYLFITYPNYEEGILSRFKSSLVSRDSLADIARSINLGNYLFLGRGEEASGGRYRANMLEDLFEAIVGAIYLDSGLDSAKSFIFRVYEDRLKKLNVETFDKDYKTMFQEIIQKKYKVNPIYSTIEHNIDFSFKAEVFVLNKSYGVGFANNKKEAETKAAKEALEKINKKGIKL